MEKFDLIVVGGGPGGYPLALKMAQKGWKTAIVEHNGEFGGTCMNRGCIPTKALLTSAANLHLLKECSAFGLECSDVKSDWGKTVARKNQITSKMRQDIEKLLVKNKVTVFNGLGRLYKNHIVKITDSEGSVSEIEGEKICLAVGSVPSVPGIFPSDRSIFWSSDEALNAETIPETLLIVGGGVIGMELGQVFAAFGSKITVVEMMPQILSGLDSAVARRLLPVFKKSGLEIMTGKAVESLSAKDGKAAAVIGGQEYTFDKVLISIGRKVNYSFMQDTDLQLERDGAFLKIDSNFMTSEDGVYAVGDAVKGPMLAHKASYDSMVLADKWLGGHLNADYSLVPGCVFTHPEIAWVGLSEDKLKENNISYTVGRSMYSANGKAVSMGDSDGQVKVMLDSEGKLLGAVIWGPDASNIINEATLMAHFGIKAEDFVQMIHPHPTLSEVFKDAVENGLSELSGK